MNSLKIKTILFAGFLFAGKLASYGQEIKISLLDKGNNSPVPFVTVLILRDELELFSDKDGILSMNTSKLNPTDSIVFNRIGYYNLRVTFQDLETLLSKQNHMILLEPKINQLQEVIVRPRVQKFSKSGNGSGSKWKQIGIGKDSTGCEIGTIIPVRFPESTIEKVTFRLTQNKYGSMKFKINLYQIENNAPGTKINKEPIYFESESKSGTCEVDLKNYGIVVNSDIFLSIEYMQDMGKYSVYYSATFNKNPTFYKDSRNSKWVKIMHGDDNISISLNTIQSHYEDIK
jgi:hypothetical protein